MSKNSDIKDKVRKTKEWKEFREKLIKEQKISFISEKKLLKGANCHHLDLDVNHYDIFDDEHQVMLNRKDHEVLHYIYGDEKTWQKQNWKRKLERLKLLCEMMDRYQRPTEQNND